MVLSVKGPTFGVGSGDDVRVMGLSPVSGYARHVGPDEGSLSSSATPTPPPKQKQRRERDKGTKRERVRKSTKKSICKDARDSLL